MNEALVSDLSCMETIRDADKCHNLLDQVDNLLETNRMDIEECAVLFKLTASNNAKVKCRVWNLMVKVCEQDQDFAFMLIASLKKDIMDPNPLIRSSAVSTVSSIPGLEQFSVPAIRQGLQDGNPSVRIAAVTGIGKLWLHSAAAVQEHGLIDDLYSTLRDATSSVIVFSLQTLAFLLEKEGGIVMTRKMVAHFLSRVPTFADPEFCALTEYLGCAGGDVETVLDVLNDLDVYLESKNCNVVLAVAKLFVKLVSSHAKLQPSLIRRLTPVLVMWIKQTKRDFQYDLIKFSLQLKDEYFVEFTKEKEIIKFKSKDGETLREQKFLFLIRLANKESCREIMNTLLNQLPGSGSSSLSSIIIQGACDVSQLDPQVRSDCTKNLDLLIKSEPNTYLPIILDCHLYLDPETNKDCKAVNDLVETIFQKTNPKSCNPKILPQILTIIEQFGYVTKTAPYLLEDLFSIHVEQKCNNAASSFSSDTMEQTPPTAELYSCFLTAAMALFDLYAATMQPILGNIMHKCSKVNDYRLSLQVRCYYSILLKKAS